MKIPSVFDKFLPKKKLEKEIFSSMILAEEFVSAALWEMGSDGTPQILAAASQMSPEDSWTGRLDAVDEALATVEDKVGTTSYSKVVLGLPNSYLTGEGDIQKEVRSEIKILTKELELTPIGFVPISQAILYRLKKEEGVPPSAILLYVTKKTITVSLYRVGALAGEVVKDRATDTAITLEEALKEYKNLEVLPARILLFGNSTQTLTDVRNELLRYPWTTRLNFLHFPKIDAVSPQDLAHAVALAGASELSHEVGESPEPVAGVAPEARDTNVEQAAEPVPEEEAEAEAEAEAEEVEEGEEIAVEEPNVIAVDPSKLGFRKNVDVLEEVEAPVRRVPRIVLPPMPHVDFSAIGQRILTGPKGLLVALGVVILLAIGLLFWFVPHATVTVLTLPKSLTASETITIDPTATALDADKKIIPGSAQEKSVSGQKTIPVTGKKNVGDPAKGSVTIYNKTTDAKTFAKGAVLTSGTLQFTLDADVQVASASESVGSLTFGKATGTITASQIGTDSNLAAGTEFHFKDTGSGDAIARNDSALTGGTSKSVTVVSRADQDALVKAISADLVDKAKTDLSGSVSGSQKLIDGTITTAVTQKTFTQELDQEATQLAGSATVTVSGTSYNGDDVKTLMKSMITGQIPSGYTLAEGRTQVTLSNVKVAKDGKISAKATITTDAMPTLDVADIQKHIAGKSITSTQEYLRSLTGVAGVEVRFGMTFSKSRLPVNAKNISVDVAIQ